VDRPGLYLSTVSEPLDKLLRYGESLRFFDVEKVGRSVFYDDLGSVLNDGGLSAVLERIDLLVKEHRPSVVVIDSFKALKAFADGEAPFRRFLHELAGRMTALAVSSIWVGERRRGRDVVARVRCGRRGDRSDDQTDR
jgi:circadian clock protein KaiC